MKRYNYELSTKYEASVQANSEEEARDFLEDEVECMSPYSFQVSSKMTSHRIEFVKEVTSGE